MDEDKGRTYHNTVLDVVSRAVHLGERNDLRPLDYGKSQKCMRVGKSKRLTDLVAKEEDGEEGDVDVVGDERLEVEGLRQERRVT
jgi:hypothetical protein